MAPAAGVSEALTAARCRVALAFAPCQTVCVVNRRLGSCRGGRQEGCGSRQKPHFSSSRCVAIYLFRVHQSDQFAFVFQSRSLADLV